ncbi:TolC family protein [Granulicella paludicola]|uniref:TolC family protein n=1 Tax=Granulicella paludicola TaxID=474951 RepID=UPI0021E04F62|nr:TolC family protein [Granulicella paludicola]
MPAFVRHLRSSRLGNKRYALLAIAATFVLQLPLHAQTPGGSSSSTDLPPADYAKSIQIPDPRKPLPAKSGALTLQQVLDEARTKNLTLLAAERNLRAVKAQEIQAGVRQNPNLGFAGSDVTEPSSSNNPYSYSVQVSRLFERGDKRKWRLEDARATTAQTQAQLEDTTRQTVLAVKTAFTNMLMAKASLQLASDSLKEFQHEVKIATDRYQAGDLSKIDFERLDLQLASFESDESNNIVALRQASDQLQTLMGIETPSMSFDILGDVVPPLVAQSQAALLQTAIDKRPDYAAAKFGIAAAEANQKLAYANGTTDPTLEAEYDRSGTENSAGFSVNIPLRIFDRNQGNKKTAEFQTESSKFTAAAAHNQVVSDVDQAWVNYEQSKRLSDRYTQHYLDETTDVLSIAQFAFEHGGIALIDYLDAVRDTRTTNTAAISAYQQTWIAIHQLSAASASELIP